MTQQRKNEGKTKKQLLAELKKMKEKHSKKSAEINLAKYKNIFNATTDGLIIIDFDDNIIDANPQLCKMFGYTYDEILKRKGRELAPP